MIEGASNALGHEEIEFRLVTNRSVGVDRFVEFLTSLGQLGVERVPPYNLEIVELGKGSIFARLAVRWREYAPDEAWQHRMEAEIDRLSQADSDIARRNMLAAERSADAAERSANAAERSAEDTRKTRQYTGFAAGTGAVLLAFTAYSTILDAQTSRSANAVADLCEHDSMTCLEIKTREFSFTINAQDIPEVQRRGGLRIKIDAGDYTSAGAAAGLYAGRTLPGRPADDGNIPADKLAEDMTQAPDSDDEALFDEPFDEARFAGPSLNDENGRSSGYARRAGKHIGYPGQVLGVVEAAGDAFVLQTDEDQGKSERITLIPPIDADVTDGGRYSFRGNIFYVPGSNPIFVATNMRRIDLPRK